MKIFGVSMVRNEADIVDLNIRYHLSLGIDRVLVLDNGSTDGTDEVLRSLVHRDERVSWIRDDSPFDQATITTELAREAFRLGADWIVPFDADEFWWAERNKFREILARSQAGVLRTRLVNFVQSRNVRDLKRKSLLAMIYRLEEKNLGWGPDTRKQMDEGNLAYIEVAYPPKCISRPTEEIEIKRGNHNVSGVRGPRVESDQIFCLHAPLRSRMILENKAEQGRRLDEAGVPPQEGWHLRRWATLEKQDRLETEWAANSYLAGRLDLGNKKRVLIPDSRLKDALSPLVRPKSPNSKPDKKRESPLENGAAQPLFVAGCQRSGTTAFAEYMNVHPEVMLLRERYKFIPHEVTPDLLSFDRILAYSAGETNVPQEQYEELLGCKDPSKLRWVGDKNPDYHGFFGRLVRQNPGARFVVLYRPLEEVAESFDARARNPEDHWPAYFDFWKAVGVWNNALSRTRAFIEGDAGAKVLVLNYHDFFYRSESCVPLISHFLQINFDEQVLADWRSRSKAFADNQRQKTTLTKEREDFLKEEKNHEAEEWMLKRIEDQRDDPDICFRARPARPAPVRAQPPEAARAHLREENSRKRFLRLRRRVRHLSLENRRLTNQLAEVRGSRTWKLLDAINRLRKRLLHST